MNIKLCQDNQNSNLIWKVSKKPCAVLPAVILADESLAELVHHSAQHGTGIVSKVQISDLHHRYRDDGKGLLILFGGTRS